MDVLVLKNQSLYPNRWCRLQVVNDAQNNSLRSRSPGGHAYYLGLAQPFRLDFSLVVNEIGGTVSRLNYFCQSL